MLSFARSLIACALFCVALVLAAWPHSQTRLPRAETRALAGAFTFYDMPDTTTTEPPVTTTEPPTTTTSPPPVAARPAPAQTSWPASLEPCGGDLPPCYVKQRESHGDYNAVSPDGQYRGAWQFAYGTWGGYGGYQYANEAPPAVQDARAREVWAGGAGCGHWNACG